MFFKIQRYSTNSFLKIQEVLSHSRKKLLFLLKKRRKSERDLTGNPAKSVEFAGIFLLAPDMRNFLHFSEFLSFFPLTFPPFSCKLILVVKA